jgi:metallo-beta-lactamase family protein
MFLTHGEPAAADAFRKHIERRLGWHPEIPEYRDVARIK